MSNTPKKAPNHRITMRPLPGTRFTIYGSDVILECQAGTAEKQLEWLEAWLDSYVRPIADKERRERIERETTESTTPEGIAAAIAADLKENGEAAVTTAPESPQALGSIPKKDFQSIIRKANGSDPQGFSPERYMRNQNR